MNADDFRDYMLSFLFLRYLSDNYEPAAKKELGTDYPDPNAIGNGGRSPLSVWYAQNPDDVAAFEKQMRRKVHYVIKPRAPLGQHRPPGPHAERRAAQHAAGGLQVHRERIVPEHLLRACSRRSISARTSWARPTPTATPSSARSSPEIAEGLAEFSTDTDTLGDAYEYLIGQFAAGSGKKAGEFYTPQQISDILSAHRHARQPGAEDRQAEAAGQRVRLRLRLRLAAAERAQAHGAARHRQDLRAGEEHHHLQPRAHEHAAARGEGHGVRDLPRRHADQRLGHAARDRTRRRSRSSTPWSPIRRSATAGSRPRRWARTCASRTTAWRPKSRPTSRSCCTGFTT